MLQAGIFPAYYAILMVEILKDNARPENGEVYGAMDMGWAKLAGQIGGSLWIPGDAVDPHCGEERQRGARWRRCQ